MYVLQIFDPNKTNLIMQQSLSTVTERALLKVLIYCVYFTRTELELKCWMNRQPATWREMIARGNFWLMSASAQLCGGTRQRPELPWTQPQPDGFFHTINCGWERPERGLVGLVSVKGCGQVDGVLVGLHPWQPCSGTYLVLHQFNKALKHTLYLKHVRDYIPL